MSSLLTESARSLTRLPYYIVDVSTRGGLESVCLVSLSRNLEEVHERQEALRGHLCQAVAGACGL